MTDLTEYDFILHLDPRHNPRTAESIAGRRDPYVSKLWEGHLRNQTAAGLASKKLKAGFDPVSMMLADLQVRRRNSLDVGVWLTSLLRYLSAFTGSKPCSSMTSMEDRSLPVSGTQMLCSTATLSPSLVTA